MNQSIARVLIGATAFGVAMGGAMVGAAAEEGAGFMAGVTVTTRSDVDGWSTDPPTASTPTPDHASALRKKIESSRRMRNGGIVLTFAGAGLATASLGMTIWLANHIPEKPRTGFFVLLVATDLAVPASALMVGGGVALWVVGQIFLVRRTRAAAALAGRPVIVPLLGAGVTGLSLAWQF